MTFRENRRDDVVAAIKIGRQFRDQIGVPIAQPKVMMRIDNGKVRLQSVFRGLGKPSVIRRCLSCIGCDLYFLSIPTLPLLN